MHVAQLASFACEMLGPRIGAFSNLVLEIGLCPVLTGVQLLVCVSCGCVGSFAGLESHMGAVFLSMVLTPR